MYFIVIHCHFIVKRSVLPKLEIGFTRKTFGFTHRTIGFTRKTLDFTRKTFDITRKTLHFTRKRVIYDTNGRPYTYYLLIRACSFLEMYSVILSQQLRFYAQTKKWKRTI